MRPSAEQERLLRRLRTLEAEIAAEHSRCRTEAARYRALEARAREARLPVDGPPRAAARLQRWLLGSGWLALLVLAALLSWQTIIHSHRCHRVAASPKPIDQRDEAKETGSGLVLHISPDNATVIVNSRILIENASDTVRLPARPGEHQRIMVVRPGYRPRKTIVAVPDEGYRHVYIGLKRKRRRGS